MRTILCHISDPFIEVDSVSTNSYQQKMAYKIIKDKMIEKSASENICNFYLDGHAVVADLNSYDTFQKVSRSFISQNITGIFWVQGSPKDEVKRKWKPCEPGGQFVKIHFY